MEGFHGDVINNQVFVFVDKEQVFASSDDALGEYLDQKIALNGKFPGKHDLKFGLMVKSKFCVKGVTEDESLLLYIDNIRLVN